VRSGTPSTPRFFINSVIHLGFPSRAALEGVISVELSAVVPDADDSG
jgi:hypothetical protein